MRTLLVAFLVFSLAKQLVAQTPLSIQQSLDAVLQYESAFYGKTVVIRPTHGYNERLGIEVQVSSSGDGRFSRVLQTLAMNDYQLEVCVADKQLVMAAKQGHRAEIGLTGVLDCDLHAASAAVIGHGLVGVSPLDGVPFSRILSDQSTTLTCERAHLEGEAAPCQVLVGRNPDQGEFRFWLIVGDRPLVKQIQVLKRSGNRAFESSLLGFTTIGADPYVGIDPDEKVNAKQAAAASKLPRERERMIVLGPIEYKFFPDGSAYPCRMNITATSRYHDQSDFSMSAGVEIAEVRSFHCPSPDKAQFDVLKVRNGMPVQVRENIGAAFEFRDGRIVRMVDVDSVGKMDGIRYRKPTTHGRYYLVLVLIAVLALAVLLRNRVWHR